MGKSSKRKSSLRADRAHRGEQTPSSAAGQMGATEQQVVPLTPPMQSNDSASTADRNQKQSAAEREIDPSDELTPG